jgi:hypothetical protein
MIALPASKIGRIPVGKSRFFPIAAGIARQDRLKEARAPAKNANAFKL